MTLLEFLQAVLLVGGVAFFVVGTLGLLRLPDIYTRVHALTKADNLGLGLIVIGLLPGAGSPAGAVKLLLIWVLALLASATAGYLVARAARRDGVEPWSGRPEAGDD
jgi:multicomponent Na+:H+ antiporter subunit G